ncbi:MAG: amidohydrolase family protein [Actinobacteria bacterium]|nr:amidohydrolase family protein [Actinomycetota bacterium]
MTELHVTNGSLVIPEMGIIPGTLVIVDGRVDRIVRAGEDAGTPDREIDADGKYVMPGFIDPHLHSGILPPLGERLQAESAFAAAGGITTTIRYVRRTESYMGTFPTLAEFDQKNQYQDFTHHLTLFTAEQASEMRRYVEELGITSFKLYMNLKGPLGKGVLMDLLPDSGDEMSPGDVDFDEGHMYDVFDTAARLPARVRINVHCELGSIVQKEMERVQEMGLEGLPAWHASRPGFSEALAIQMVASFSHRFGVPVYYPHIGSHEAIEALADARRLGADFVAETCPQYVSLSTESEAGTLAKVMPPVRTTDDATAVWLGINDDLLTCLGSDHIAYTLEEKKPGSIWTTRPAFGGTGMMIPIFLSEGVNRGRISISRLAELGSYNTAKAFGLYPRKGTLLPGSDGDFVIVDLEKEWAVHAEQLLSASDYSVYEDMTLKGVVAVTAVRGEVIYEDGKLVGSPGSGRFCRRFPEIQHDSTYASS